MIDDQCRIRSVGIVCYASVVSVAKFENTDEDYVAQGSTVFQSHVLAFGPGGLEHDPQTVDQGDCMTACKPDGFICTRRVVRAPHWSA